MSGSTPIHVLRGASAILAGQGRITAQPPTSVLAAAHLSGEGRFTGDYRTGMIFDEAELGGRAAVKHALAGVVRGAISFAGRLGSGVLLRGKVQGDQK
jgi:hypothetical protein